MNTNNNTNKEFVPDYANADYSGLTQLMNNANITNKENENKNIEDDSDIEVEEEEEQEQEENKIIWPNNVKLLKDKK
ncbi:MAG: hypothetical protein IIZ40_03975 [Bacilli bacterium]|nr:hypothetical protein [Bacilli bacterium]